MQISECRTQNIKFVCGVRRTCKQNNLRKSQVIFMYDRRDMRTAVKVRKEPR